MLGRVRLLLLAFALANLVGALVVMVASHPSPQLLYVAGISAPPVLAFAWLWVYRRREFGVAADVAVIGAICVFTMAVDERLDTDVSAVLTAAVFFGAAYGSLQRVIIRTALLSAVAVGQGLSDPTLFTIGCGFAVGFAIVAILMHGMVSAISRYQRTVARQQILAAAGLDLVAACDLASVVAATVECAYALCEGRSGTRVSLAVADGPGIPPPRYRVVGSAGHRADEVLETELSTDQLAPDGEGLADQRMVRQPIDEAAEPASPAPTAGSPRRAAFMPGEVLLTRVSVAGAARGLLIVESTDAIPDELPDAIRALSTQAALALSRTDAQDDQIERESAERFQALVHSSGDVISIVSVDGRIRYQSPSVQKVLGYDPEALLGTDFAKLVHPDDEERVTAEFRGAAAEPGSSRICECQIRHADGSWRHTETHMTSLLDVPAVNGVVLNSRDVTERRALEAELRHQAFHDTVTGLANRALFADRIELSLTAARRDGSTVAVLTCDMDGFERLNEGLGYQSGDAALTMLADRLRSCVRGQDTVARLGGSEFGLLLDRLASPADATLAMEQIIGVLGEPLPLQGASVELQPHIGVAIAVAGNDTAEEMLGNSAMAVRPARFYEGGYAIFDPEMHADAIQRIEVESQMRTAIEQSQFLLYYQPTIDLRTGRLTGVEALARWLHPRRGMVSPKEFIPLAEENGLIVPFGQWAIREACRQVRVWQKEIPAEEPICLNVNLSARQLRHPGIVRDIEDALDDSGLSPSRLILEITESVIMADTPATLNRLFQLKSLGARLAIDDFGTGYSSFAYLRRFPVDIIKIDRSFVDGVATEPTACALVDAMIRIGKTLRLETVAEGIETAEQAERLRTLQCDIGQGYLFSRPLPIEAIRPFLRDRLSGHEATAA
ncbi:MAG: EAL domain-containing protein [Candidatus Limnocylindrales bacterium]